jgi:hypothetical protein
MSSIIAETEFYSIETDRVKNRAYLTFTGFCKDVDKMSNFLNDIEKATQGLTKGFTLLTDASQMKTPSKEVSDLHESSQKIWIEKGLLKTAEIIPESAMVQMTLKRYSSSTGMKKKEFQNRVEAEAWLDLKEE